MVFAAYSRLLVTSKGGVRGVGVIVVDLHAPRLDTSAHPVTDVGLAAPDPGPEAVERVVGDLESVGLVLECCH